MGLLATMVDCVTGLPIADWPSPVIFQEIKTVYSEASFLLGQLAFGVKDATVGYTWTSSWYQPLTLSSLLTSLSHPVYKTGNAYCPGQINK